MNKSSFRSMSASPDCGNLKCEQVVLEVTRMKGTLILNCDPPYLSFTPDSVTPGTARTAGRLLECSTLTVAAILKEFGSEATEWSRTEDCTVLLRVDLSADELRRLGFLDDLTRTG